MNDVDQARCRLLLTQSESESVLSGGPRGEPRAAVNLHWPLVRGTPSKSGSLRDAAAFADSGPSLRLDLES